MACFLAFARVCVSCSADAVARCVGRRRVLTAVRCLMSSDVRSVRACCLELARCGARRAARRRRATARRDGRATRRNTAQMASPSLVTSDFRDQTETRERLDLSRTFSSGLIVDIPTCPSALSKSEEGVHSPYRELIPILRLHSLGMTPGCVPDGASEESSPSPVRQLKLATGWCLGGTRTQIASWTLRAGTAQTGGYPVVRHRPTYNAIGIYV